MHSLSATDHENYCIIEVCPYVNTTEISKGEISEGKMTNLGASVASKIVCNKI